MSLGYLPAQDLPGTPWVTKPSPPPGYRVAGKLSKSKDTKTAVRRLLEEATYSYHSLSSCSYYYPSYFSPSTLSPINQRIYTFFEAPINLITHLFSLHQLNMSSSKKDQDSPELRAAQGEIDKPVQTAMPEGGTLLTERPPVSEEHLEYRLAERPPVSEEHLEGWLAEFAEEVARFHGMARSHHDFLPPDPLISYREIEDRHARVIVLENDIKIDEQKFKMSGEDLVATLMVDLEDLQEGGPLAVGEDFPNVPSEIETLEVIAKFSQHCKNTIINLALQSANNP